jgi:formate hydrogenlyase transcriptional activator
VHGEKLQINWIERIVGRNREVFEVLDNIPGLVVILTADGILDFINRQVAEYFGRTLEQLREWTITDSIHPDDLAQTAATLGRALETGQPYQLDTRFRRFDGTYRWFHHDALPVRDADNRIVRWCVLFTDIHERKTAEEKLRQDEMEVREITNAIPDGIHVFRPDGTIFYVNKTALDYSGLTLADAQREDYIPRLVHPSDYEKVRDYLRQVLTRTVPFDGELRLLGRDGNYRWFLVRYNPLVDETGSPIRWYATATDIEDRKRTEEKTRNENLALREEITRSSMFEEIIGSSRPLRTVLNQITKVAPTDSTVLISGETGTGKELIARAIHRLSNRSARAFISVNCGAIPQSLIASELFGYEKGAFTGALQRRVGRFEAADGGTIFLDEVGELPMETQVALLRVLQERELERLGSSDRISLDVRVLAATNRDLQLAVSSGIFRQDLFYRLNVFPIAMPPLRERSDDIRLLAEYLIDRYGKQVGKRFDKLANDTLERFENYPWPGNVRELQNVIERAVVLCDEPTFSVDETWLRREPAPVVNWAVSRLVSSTDKEKELIEAALAESRGRVSGSSGAAAKLGIPRQTLESKILRLGINKHRFQI